MDTTLCPNCGSAFGFEEWEWQHCDACGWPDDERCSVFIDDADERRARDEAAYYAQFYADDDLPTAAQLDDAGWDVDSV